MNESLFYFASLFNLIWTTTKKAFAIYKQKIT